MLTVGVEAACGSCGARIVWMLTENGRRMPVDAASAKAGDTVYEHGRHTSHFATCPQGNRWRKRAKPTTTA